MSNDGDVVRTAEDAILRLIEERGAAKSICPTDAARLLAGEDWRRRLPEVRQSAIHLARAGRIAILRHNKPVDPNAFKGVYRLSLPRDEPGT
jgi:Protein of unknown function (DUF3253)